MGALNPYAAECLRVSGGLDHDAADTVRFLSKSVEDERGLRIALRGMLESRAIDRAVRRAQAAEDGELTALDLAILDQPMHSAMGEEEIWKGLPDDLRHVAVVDVRLALIGLRARGMLGNSDPPTVMAALALMTAIERRAKLAHGTGCKHTRLPLAISPCDCPGFDASRDLARKAMESK